MQEVSASVVFDDAVPFPAALWLGSGSVQRSPYPVPILGQTSLGDALVFLIEFIFGVSLLKLSLSPALFVCKKASLHQRVDAQLAGTAPLSLPHSPAGS